MRLATVTFATALAIMLGFLLWIGKPILLPVLAAVISLYVLSEAARALRTIRLFRLAPEWILRTLILLAFTTAIALLFFLVIANFGRVAAALPSYESNLDALVARAAGWVGIEDEPNWEIVRDATLGRVSATQLIAPLFNQLRGFGTTLFLIVLYAAFLFAERASFSGKLAIAIGDDAPRTHALITRVNSRVGEYLLVKTLVNILLAVISFVLMYWIGIEFALFWAVLIGFMNYVPYVGSLLGVLFPVLLSLAQSGSFAFAIGCLVALTAAQIYIGAVVEPRLMGRRFNLSPLVVLLSLAFWGALWGIAGAILAVPLTASLVIVLGEIERTRPVAVMLSSSGRL